MSRRGTQFVLFLCAGALLWCGAVRASGSDPELDALKDPNVQWVFLSNIAACPAGDSVVSGHPRRVSIQVLYSSSLHIARAGVPPESVWVVAWPQSDEHNPSNAFPFDFTTGAGPDSAKIFAEDSTGADGKTWVRISGLAGCGTLGLRLFVSGVIKREGSVEVRSVDADGDGIVTSGDVEGACDINYSPFGDDGAIVQAHLGHSHRQFLHGTMVRRTNLCGTCETGEANTLGGSEPFWSPDGRGLSGSVFKARSSAQGADTVCAIMTVPSSPVDGNTLTELTFPPFEKHDYDPSWSPLGDEIIFDRGDNTLIRKGIPGLASDTTERVVIERHVGDYEEGANNPGISPDGQWVAFSLKELDGRVNLWMMPTSGDTLLMRRLTGDLDVVDRYPQWSSDGKWITFNRITGGETNPSRPFKVRVDLDTIPAPEQVLTVDGSVDAGTPSFSPDNKVIVLGVGEGRHRTRVLRTDLEASQGGVENFSAHQSDLGLFLVPRVSPDGTRLALRASPPDSPSELAQLWASRRNMSAPPAIATVASRSIANAVPAIDTTITELQSLELSMSASDPEGDSISYTASSETRNLGFSINEDTGLFSWTPARTLGTGTYNVRLQAQTASGGIDYAIARIAVVDNTDPGQVIDLDVDLLSDTEVWPLWTSPGEDGAYGQCVVYDVRYSASTITSSNFATALQASGAPAPASVGTPQEFGITGLNPNTDYWIALKARDAAGNWSAMSNVLHVKTLTSGGGGGGSRAHQVNPGALAKAGIARPEVARPGAPSMTGLAAEVRIEQGMPTWSVYFVDSSEVSGLAEAGTGVIQQVANGHGGWTTLRRIEPTGTRFALGSFRRPGRTVFLGSYGLIQAWSGVACEGGNTVLDVASARNSQLGDMTARIDSSGVYGSGLSPGDTLALTYAESAENAISQEWFLLFGAVGDIVGENALRRPRLEGQSSLPTLFALRQNHPNPFFGVTTIRFDLPVGTDVRLDVFDAQGRRIKTLVSAHYPAGFQSVQWDHRTDGGRQVGAGVYLYRIQAGSFRDQKKMVLLGR